MRTFSWIAVGAGWVVAGAASGCDFEATLPPNAQVRCASNGDCPVAGQRCSESLGVCVVVGDDQTPPGVLAPSVEPAVLSGGSFFTVRFTASEPLGVPPAVRLDGGAELSVDPVVGTGVVAHGGISGAEGDGPHVLTADLVDRFGNQAQNITIGQIIIDTAAPALEGVVVVSPPVARAGTDVIISAGFNGAASVTATVGDVVAAPSAGGFALTIDPQTLTEGPHAILLTATDAAGNVATVPGGTLMTDYTAPTISLGAPLDDVRAGSPFDVTLSATEAVDVPTVSLAGVPLLARTTAPGTTFVFTGTAPAASGVEPLVLDVTAADAAGNVSLAPLDTGAHVDGAAPQLHVTVAVQRAGVEIPPPDLGANAADVLVLSVDHDEPIDALQFTLDSRTLIPSSQSTFDANPVVIVVPLLESGIENLLAPVFVEARDRVGNLGSTGATVAVDAVPPHFTAVFGPSIVSGGETAQLVVSSSEPVEDASVLLTWAALDPGLKPLPSLNVGFTHTSFLFSGVFQRIGGSDSPSRDFILTSVTGRDPAGNVGINDVGSALTETPGCAPGLHGGQGALPEDCVPPGQCSPGFALDVITLACATPTLLFAFAGEDLTGWTLINGIPSGPLSGAPGVVLGTMIDATQLTFVPQAPIGTANIGVSIEFDLDVIGGWQGEDTVNGKDRFQVVVGGAVAFDASFARFSGLQSFPDNTGAGFHPADTGAVSVDPDASHYHVRFYAVTTDPEPPILFTSTGRDAGEAVWAVDNVSILVTEANCTDTVCLPGEDVQCGCLPLCNNDGICQPAENVCACPVTNENCPALPPNQFCQ